MTAEFRNVLVSFVASFWALDHLNRQTNKRVMSGNVTLPTHSELLILYFPNNTWLLFFFIFGKVFFFFFQHVSYLTNRLTFLYLIITFGFSMSHISQTVLLFCIKLYPSLSYLSGLPPANCIKNSDSKWPPRSHFRAKTGQMTIKCEFWPTSSNNFNFFNNMLWKILFWDISTGGIWLMLLFTMADLQLFSDWFIFVFHYFTCKE